jgi:hypothetical protein
LLLSSFISSHHSFRSCVLAELCLMAICFFDMLCSAASRHRRRIPYYSCMLSTAAAASRRRRI